MATVEAVASIGECDLTEFDASASSGQLDDLPYDATAGSYYILLDGEQTVAVGVVSMSDGVVSVFAYTGSDGATTDSLIPLIEIFAEKLPRFRSHFEACVEAHLRFLAGETGPEVDILERCDGLEEYMTFQAG